MFASLRGYKKDWAQHDALAALTLLVIAVPEQLATSRLAGMPPVTAYYAFVAGTVMFALLGSNPVMSVGADSTIAPLFAVGIGHLAATGSDRYVQLVAILAVTVGVFVALVGLLRLGWIADYLSAPIIAGFLGGVAVIIVVRQLPALLGVSGAEGSTSHQLRVVGSHLDAVNWWTLGIGLGVIALIALAQRVDRRLPGPLVALLGSTALVAIAGLRSHGVAVIGTFSHSAPRWGLAGLSLSSLRDVVPLAGVVALVVVTQSAATTRGFAGGRQGPANVSRDFIGVGAGSVLAGLAGAFPVDASPPRTGAVAEAGGRSQAACLAAAVAVVALLPAAGLLRDLPLATLAAVLIVVAVRIFPGSELLAIARFDRFEFVLAAVTLLTVALVGIQQGIGLAVVLALLDRTRLAARPQLHVLGLLPGTTSWIPVSASQETMALPGVLVVLFATSLWYGNASRFEYEMTEAMQRAGPGTKAVVLDAGGMSDIDFTGSRALAKVLNEVEARHLLFAVARIGDRARQGFVRSGLAARIGEERFFPSVGEAVSAVLG